jgi:hypothetical protein
VDQWRNGTSSNGYFLGRNSKHYQRPIQYGPADTVAAILFHESRSTLDAVWDLPSRYKYNDHRPNNEPSLAERFINRS